MTASTGFSLLAGLLVLVVLAILIVPLLRTPRRANGVDQRAVNLDILRDQMGELEREHGTGLLSAADFAQAKNELQRRLLDEVQPEAATSGKASPGRKTALVLLFALPLAVLSGYLLLGTPQALDPMNTQARVGPQQIEAMLVRLATRLKDNPDDSKGWVMLARSYKVLGRYGESAEAYSHGGALVDGDPALLADYAEVLAQANGGRFDGKPSALIARALELSPDEPQALFLAGAAATDRRDLPAIIDYWGRLLAQMEPNSEEAKSLGAAVTKAREVLAQAGGSKVAKAAPARPEAIAGTVSLGGKLAAQAKPDDLLFIFARADEGSRMPLAVIRLRVADLPFNFVLDDTMALPGGRKISEFATLSVEARVAKAGQAKSSSGDLFGDIKGLKPGKHNVKLVIDQIQP